ncbi:MAG: recombinase RecT [Candidatus Heimdallarchaeaceae archaeon]
MSEKKELSLVQEANAELQKQTADPAVMKALMATTFKGLKTELLVKQACLEAMINGWSFEDLVRKRVYAIPYGQGYSLVESIENVRSVAMKSGQAGKDKPLYLLDKAKINEFNTDGIVSCEMTVYKIMEGIRVPYTAEVYFDEFYKSGKTWNGKYTPSMWDKMPHTMIAKVAEMHSLRMAFPEELSKSYIEDEFNDSNNAQYVDVSIEEKISPELISEISNAKTSEELIEIYNKNEGLGSVFSNLITAKQESLKADKKENETS